MNCAWLFDCKLATCKGVLVTAFTMVQEKWQPHLLGIIDLFIFAVLKSPMVV